MGFFLYSLQSYLLKTGISAWMICLFILTGVSVASAQEIHLPVVLRNHTVDFGKIRQGKTSRIKVIFKNVSEETIMMGCVNTMGIFNKTIGCDVTPEKLNPHDSGIITISLNAGAPPGRLSDSFIFEIRRGKQVIQEEKIRVKANILTASGDKSGPVMLLENNVCNLDNFQPNSQHTCTFRLRNTGDEALIVKVQAESDSLNIIYPKDPIPPGKASQITATFNVNSETTIRKYLSLTTNMKDNSGKTVLVIKGKIQK